MASPPKNAGPPRPLAADAWGAAADRATGWVLTSQGRAFPQSPHSGHDMSLTAWAWVEGTASWVEPTAIQLLALKASGHGEHKRSREAVRLLQDRALPSGGWNYGNNLVLGKELRAHVQPTGLALAALAGEQGAGAEVRQATDYLQRSLSAAVTLVSLSYALIGLAGHGARPQEADQWLATACTRSLRQGAPPHALALVALAALGRDCPWYADAGIREQGSEPGRVGPAGVQGAGFGVRR